MITTPSLCGLLAPLFTPNLSPDQFLEMYNSTLQLAVKEGSTIAFQLLTKVHKKKHICLYINVVLIKTKNNFSKVVIF